MGERVALIGAGAMGGAIGTRLVETGNTLSVFDLDPAKRAALAEKGARDAPSIADAVGDVDFVITSLNSAGVVGAVVLGEGGVADAAPAGTLVIDMSSIDPEATRQLAGDAAERGLRWVDSPLSGGAPKALIGELTLMAGGDAEA
ncbi:MAG: NAD(P)-binding domain-containing protein, partial [Pseudomonadota bacterium]